MLTVDDASELPRFNLREALPRLWERDARRARAAWDAEQERRASAMRVYTRRFGPLPGNVLVYFKWEGFRDRAESMIDEALETGVAPDWTRMGGADTNLVF